MRSWDDDDDEDDEEEEEDEQVGQKSCKLYFVV